MRAGKTGTGLVAHVGWLSCVALGSSAGGFSGHLTGGASVSQRAPRSPARDLIDHFRATFATISSRDSSYYWLEESCDIRRVGSRSVAMSQAPDPSRPEGSHPATSPPSAPAGKRRSALIAVACERCRKKKAKVCVGTVIYLISPIGVCGGPKLMRSY